MDPAGFARTLAAHQPVLGLRNRGEAKTAAVSEPTRHRRQAETYASTKPAMGGGRVLQNRTTARFVLAGGLARRANCSHGAKAALTAFTMGVGAARLFFLQADVLVTLGLPFRTSPGGCQSAGPL